MVTVFILSPYWLGACYGASPAPTPGFSLPGLTQPRSPGFTFVRTKVNRKSASPLRAGPPLLPNRSCIRGDAGQPLNFHRASGSLVIGAVGIRPCLTALGLRVVSYFVDGDRSVSHRRRQFVAENRCIYPFKPVGPYPLTPPVADSNEDRASAEAGRETRYRSDARRTH